MKCALDSELVINKLAELGPNLKKSNDEYVLSSNKNHLILINFSFDCYLIKLFFQCIIDKLLKEKLKTNSKPIDLINFIMKNSQWLEEELPFELNNSENDGEILTKQQWSCFNCTFLNDVDLNDCAMCSNPKDFLNIEKNSIFYS